MEPRAQAGERVLAACPCRCPVALGQSLSLYRPNCVHNQLKVCHELWPVTFLSTSSPPRTPPNSRGLMGRGRFPGVR